MQTSRDEKRPPDPAEIGGKALGLLALPKSWTPPFLVLDRSFRELWGRHPGAAALLGTTERSEWEGASELAGVAGELQYLLSVAATEPWSDGIIVRSNATGEAATHARGSYRSVRVAAREGSVLTAIDQVLAQPAAPGDTLFAIVQVAVAATASGHLSNERRVAPRRTLWMIEEETGSPPPPPRRISVAEPRSTDLRATTRPELISALRAIGGELADGERKHCEWAWDGTRVWVVQRDLAPAPDGAAVERYLSNTDPPLRRVDAKRLALIRPVTPADANRWSKQRRPRTFEELGLPLADVFHLTADALAERPDTVRRDLEAILGEGDPIVIRCDVAAASRHDDLSLPTSGPSWSADELLRFMREEATQSFERAAVPPNARAFLPAQLVPARASVMVHARPGAQRVRLDALWGFPDGVGLLTHDTYFHDRLGDRVEATQAFKGSCLVFARERGWCFEDVPPPWDWARVIDDDEVRTAARWARQVADHLATEVQLMVLARIGGRRGARAMLPWHYTDHAVPASSAPMLAVPSTARTVAEPADLGTIAPGTVPGVHLRPQVEFRRDPAFLTEVGRRAAAANVPVFFTGSVLGHPYYLLRATGAVVIPVGPHQPESADIQYDKLVRDGIPDLVRASGARARVVHAASWQALALLSHKLIEEAFEVATASEETLLEELADLMEVVRALCVHARVGIDDVERVRVEKQAARGGFAELTYLEATAADVADASPRADVLFDDDATADRLPRHRVDVRPVEVVEESARSLVLRVSAIPPLRHAIAVPQYGLSIGEASLNFRHDASVLEISVSSPPGDQLELELDA